MKKRPYPYTNFFTRDILLVVEKNEGEETLWHKV